MSLVDQTIAAIAFGAVGLVLFAVSFFVVIKVTPFSVRREIEEDQNVALAIIIAAVILGVALIVSSSIRG